MQLEVFLIGVLRALVEVALLSLLAQGIVGLLAGAARQGNPVWRLFAIVTRPPLQLVRFLAPRQIADRHVPFLAGCVLFGLWIVLAYLKRSLCAAGGLVC